MKKFLSLVIAMLMVAALVGCNTTKKTTDKFDANNPPAERDASGLPLLMSWDKPNDIVGYERLPSTISEIVSVRIANTTKEDALAYIQKLKKIGYTYASEEAETENFIDGYMMWSGVFKFESNLTYRATVTQYEQVQSFRDGTKFTMEILWAASSFTPGTIPTVDPDATPISELPTEEPELTDEPTAEPTEEVVITDEPALTDAPSDTDTPDTTPDPAVTEGSEDIGNTDAPTDEPETTDNP